MKLLLPSFLCAAVVAFAASETIVPRESASGEEWIAGGQLQDFSFAGYHRGEKPIPNMPQTSNAKDFGAVGDGVADDTKSIQAAINATRSGAVFLPPGRYLISDYLKINKSGVVLRGAGPEKSVLWFPRGLSEIHPKNSNTSTGEAASGYSFNGGFITLEGNYHSQRIAGIVGTAGRGDYEVNVDDAEGISVGQSVLVVVHEARDRSLASYLYSGDPGDISGGKRLDTSMVMKVIDVSGTRVRFDRALRFETRADWKPEIRSFDPTVTDSGVEGLRFEFPNIPYAGHFKEAGANAIELRDVHHCWVRNVRIHNGDLGINVVANGNTISGITFTADPGRGIADAEVRECTGHHAIQCKDAQDNLVTNFDVQASYFHDLAVEHASGNVFTNGRGTDLNLDHHKDTPHDNLFSNIDCGRGKRVWSSGGGQRIGRHCAGWGTFWNIRASRPIEPPPKNWGPTTMNFIGLAPVSVEPPDLHAAQLKSRNSK